MKIFEVKYTDGRKFKVAISDNTKDLDCLISEAHKKGTVETRRTAFSGRL